MAGLDVVANPPILAMKDTSSYTTVLMLYNASQASSSKKMVERGPCLSTIMSLESEVEVVES